MFGTLLYLSFLLFLVITGVSSVTIILNKSLKNHLGNISTVVVVVVSKKKAQYKKKLKNLQKKNDLPDFNN